MIHVTPSSSSSPTTKSFNFFVKDPKVRIYQAEMVAEGNSHLPNNSHPHSSYTVSGSLNCSNNNNNSSSDDSVCSQDQEEEEGVVVVTSTSLGKNSTQVQTRQVGEHHLSHWFFKKNPLKENNKKKKISNTGSKGISKPKHKTGPTVSTKLHEVARMSTQSTTRESQTALCQMTASIHAASCQHQGVVAPNAHVDVATQQQHTFMNPMNRTPEVKTRFYYDDHQHVAIRSEEVSTRHVLQPSYSTQQVAVGHRCFQRDSIFQPRRHSPPVSPSNASLRLTSNQLPYNSGVSGRSDFPSIPFSDQSPASSPSSSLGEYGSVSNTIVQLQQHVARGGQSASSLLLKECCEEHPPSHYQHAPSYERLNNHTDSMSVMREKLPPLHVMLSEPPKAYPLPSLTSLLNDKPNWH
ncbi:hypothetical protein C9374_006071 [Naegleria lovaniensis]|uniref:Uncharacterized protein n=1 Tax=Naegleria lovaniensis TaxID=51637 RepID=A0AA88GNR1_NAELO|nr:uncharacterized protein C9374_006071 [Naegleria lovaniensis]KAG2381687.1 hypothetical protein C9374_006071 [Naegleria lovaniensis]